MMDSIKFETDEVIVTGTRTNQKIIDINTAAIAEIQKQTEADYNTKVQDISK